MNLDVGTGDFWVHPVEIGPHVAATMSVQRRLTGQFETFLVVAPTGAASESFDALAPGLLATSHPLKVSNDPMPLEGSWMRVPSALKRPAYALLYRQLLDQQPRQITVELPPLNIAHRVTVPPNLPSETSAGQYLTSGLLHLRTLSVLRISSPEPIYPAHGGPPFRLSTEHAINPVYSNGPAGWLDAIVSLQGTPDTMALQIEPA